MYLRLYEETILVVLFQIAPKEPGPVKNSLWVTSGIMLSKELEASGQSSFSVSLLKTVISCEGEQAKTSRSCVEDSGRPGTWLCRLNLRCA